MKYFNLLDWAMKYQKKFRGTINCVIPDIEATFIGTKGCDGFAEVVKDFENANEVRILTYSRIGYKKRKNEKLRALQTLREDTKLRIVIALPEVKNFNNDGMIPL